ncbi:MAG TPA: GHKL domain-containing protein [Thiotrichaceae bacterium]|nr:GHKL domain-containing protein [Thiotrichaceae bacterium]
MLSFRDVSIKNKLNIVIILTSAIILLIASVAFVVNDSITYRRQMITDLFTLADLVGINSTAGLIFNNSRTTQKNIAALKANPHIILTHIFSTKGQIFAHYFREGVEHDFLHSLPENPTLNDYYALHNINTPANQPIEDSYFFNDDHVDIFKSLFYKGKRVGTVHLQSDLDAFHARFLWAAGIVASVFFVSLLLAFVLASKLQHLITAPIYTLLATMKVVSNDKNYSIRGQKQSDDELGSLIEGFNNMLGQIEKRDKELAQANKDISQALEHLKVTQQELVQSEKMAALGHLVAGIAHEINTPLGAIRSSVDSIAIFLAENLEQLPDFFQSLSSSRQQDFKALLHKITQQQTILTSKEKRKYRRALIRELEKHSVEDADTIADTLVDMGIYQEVEAFLPLLKDPDCPSILNIAYQLASLQKSTQTITTASDRAAKTVFALKSFARFDQTGQKIEANITEGIETVLTLYHNQLKHGVDLIRNYGDLPLILCYPDDLNQVWTNLVHNALQAMDYKGTLTIEVSMQDHHAIISITDFGAGIPDEIKPKIFEPFFTTKRAGEGSGLGLDIVRKIIKKHEGKITFTSEPGKTTFSVYLPVILQCE